MIIGLTGTKGASKTDIAAYLESCGFIYQPLCDEILEKLDIDKHYVIDAIEDIETVKTLRQRKNFRLLAIDSEKNKTKHHEKILKLADHVIQNHASLGDLQDHIKNLALDWLKNQKRPDWDTYFMDIAKVTSLRSNCLKRKVAALIVKDHRIISTGYNGTPRGTKNCNEGGCPRCNSFTKSGAGLGECLCSHAEENAIVQAAYHGVSIKDAIIYTTFSPCLMCTKMILNSAIKEVVYHANYPLAEVPLELLKEAGISVRKIEK